MVAHPYQEPWAFAETAQVHAGQKFYSLASHPVFICRDKGVSPQVPTLHEVPDKAPCTFSGLEKPTGSAAHIAGLPLTSFCSTGSGEEALCRTWFSSWFSAFPAELSCRKCAPWSTAICIGCNPGGLPVSLGLGIGAVEPGTGTALSCPSLRKAES